MRGILVKIKEKREKKCKQSISKQVYILSRKVFAWQLVSCHLYGKEKNNWQGKK